ncbi:MAG TPA: hypothetical protein VGR06_36635 [Actinophytocola sp.]|uniref:hypothetical protein n=1 Tax=Actinophytocola sp. TaxID=1872138 RepID=UPI002DF9C01C|nr:hypothetical protein [Actinophytocola sp.]
MKIYHRVGIAALTAAGLAMALTAGTVSAEPRPDGIVLPKTCTLQLVPVPRVDDFVVHSTGRVICSWFASTLEGEVELVRDGVTAATQEFSLSETLGAEATARMKCLNGAYQARMTAHWSFPDGSEGSDSAESPVVDIAC